MGHPDGPRQLQVFISHASGDKPRLHELLQWLRDAGTNPWFDSDSLQPGSDWDAAITRALRQSDVVLVCVSRQALRKAGYFQKEVRRALDIADEQPEESTFLIPVKLESCELPAQLARWQAIDLCDEKAFGRLNDALRTRAAQLSDAASVPTAARPDPVAPNWVPRSTDLTPQPRNRRMAWVMMTVVSLVALAAVYTLNDWLSRTPGIASQNTAPDRPQSAIPATKRIVIMDARHPTLIYDRRTREEGGTNADDIDNILSRITDVELEPRIKELIFPNWLRDADISRMNPDLVILHGSAFYRETNTRDSDERLRSFLRSMAASKARFLIYSRGAILETDVVGAVPQLTGRVRTFQVRDTFRDSVTAREFTDLVRSMLRPP